ncbi:MAG: CopL family metal-binding regulatory protein [Xanthomonadales bacterium]|nr:CopL family metal-binding regulatory protein [Xanthomonadales bacterium]MBK7145382.1 CopL family metal-binding regulatory protein [Xanthomonadales bacterium]
MNTCTAARIGMRRSRRGGIAISANRAQSFCAMYPQILRILLVATLLLNASGAPWAMSAMSQGMGHPTSHGMHAAIADAAIQAHDEHGMDHAQTHAGMPRTGDRTGADPEAAGSCCNGTTCSCGCVLPPALVFAVLPQFPQPAVLAPGVVSVEHSEALPSMPPFRPPSA